MKSTTPLAASPAAGGSPSTLGRLRQWPAWTREPLLHFLIIGAALFALDHVVASRSDDPRVIIVGPQVDAEARQLFKASRGRDPGAEELQALRRAWLDNEVLYREGLALQVDRGDSAIRERVIFKALSVVDAGLKTPAVDDRALRAWFESRRAQYDEPSRFDFQEAVLSGESSETTIRAFVDQLNKGTPGELSAGLRVFKGRPHANLVSGYGDEFAKALEQSAPGEWRALRTRDGWRAVRLDAVVAGKAALFEALRGPVLQDWTDATMAELRTQAVRALLAKYKVRTEGAAQP